MTCSLCRGAQNLMCLHEGKREWWPCPGCGGSGTRIVCAPGAYRIGRAQSGMLKPLPRTGGQA